MLIQLASGLSSKEIAAQSGRSAKTIHAQRQAIGLKLGNGNLAVMTQYAIKHGMIPVPTL